MSSPDTPHGQAGSIISDTSHSVVERLDLERVFRSGLAPLAPVTSITSIPTNSFASSGKKLIQKEEAKELGNGWGDIVTMLTQDTHNAPVASTACVRHSFDGPGRSVGSTKKNKVYGMSCSSVLDNSNRTPPPFGDTNVVLPPSITPHTSSTPPSQGNGPGDSSFATQSITNGELALSPTDYKVWEYLKSFLEGYVSGDKLAFEKQYKFRQWPEGVQAQRALSAKCASATEKLRWNVPCHETLRYRVVGLIDATTNVFKSALDVNIQVLHYSMSTARLQRKELYRLRGQCCCTKARLHRLSWNCRGRNDPEIYACECKGHAPIAAIAIEPMDGALQMQKSLEECRESVFKALIDRQISLKCRH